MFARLSNGLVRFAALDLQGRSVGRWRPRIVFTELWLSAVIAATLAGLVIRASSAVSAIALAAELLGVAVNNALLAVAALRVRSARRRAAVLEKVNADGGIDRALVRATRLSAWLVVPLGVLAVGLLMAGSRQ